MARPSAWANSRLVTGCGAVALIGPLAAGDSTAQRTISIQSSRWIHDRYWRPEPMGPPTKYRKGRIMRGSAPPDRWDFPPFHRGAGGACDKPSRRLRAPFARDYE